MSETNPQKQQPWFLDYEEDGKPVIRWRRALMFGALFILLPMVAVLVARAFIRLPMGFGPIATCVFSIPNLIWMLVLYMVTYDREMMTYRGQTPRFRFSLRLVFLLIFGVCLWLAVTLHAMERTRAQYEQRVAFAERLSQLVGKTGKARYSGSTNELMVVVKNVEFSDDDFTELVKMLEDSPDDAYVYYLDMNGTKITDASLDQIADWNGLQYLFLGGTAVTESGVRRVGTLPRLRALSAQGTVPRDVIKEIRETRIKKNLPPI